MEFIGSVAVTDSMTVMSLISVDAVPDYQVSQLFTISIANEIEKLLKNLHI